MEPVEYRLVINFLHLQEESYDIFFMKWSKFVVRYIHLCRSHNIVTYLVRKFKPGLLSEMDTDREERTPFVGTEDRITILKKLVAQNQRFTVKQLSSETEISARN